MAIEKSKLEETPDERRKAIDKTLDRMKEAKPTALLVFGECDGVLTVGCAGTDIELLLLSVLGHRELVEVLIAGGNKDVPMIVASIVAKANADRLAEKAGPPEGATKH